MKRFQLLVRQLRLRKTADRQTKWQVDRLVGNTSACSFNCFYCCSESPEIIDRFHQTVSELETSFERPCWVSFRSQSRFVLNLSKGENYQKPNRTMQHKQVQPMHEQKHSKTKRLETGICNRLTVCRYNIILFHMVLVPLRRRRDAS